MLLLWCSMAEIEGCLLIKMLFSKVSPQGKKTTMSNPETYHLPSSMLPATLKESSLG